MSYWPDLSMKEARVLITTADAVIASGDIKTGEIKTKRCDGCGIKFKSDNFNVCPVCYMAQNHPRPKRQLEPYQDLSPKHYGYPSKPKPKRDWLIKVCHIYVGICVLAFGYTVYNWYF